MATPAKQEAFDALLLNIAREHEGIDALLDSFFGFLRRKTDFFAAAPSKEHVQETVRKVVRAGGRAAVWTAVARVTVAAGAPACIRADVASRTRDGCSVCRVLACGWR